MSDLELPPPSGVVGMVEGINHPRVLPDRWRQEAERLYELVEFQRRRDAHRHGSSSMDVQPLMARAEALRQCAQELENRLLWSDIT